MEPPVIYSRKLNPRRSRSGANNLVEKKHVRLKRRKHGKQLLRRQRRRGRKLRRLTLKVSKLRKRDKTDLRRRPQRKRYREELSK